MWGTSDVYAALGTEQEFPTESTTFTVTGKEMGIREIIDRTFGSTPGQFNTKSSEGEAKLIIDIILNDGI